MSKNKKIFARKFEAFDLTQFKNESLYGILINDINSGELYPALRADRLDFYYNGDCILSYKSTGFSYNRNYIKYMGDEYKAFNSSSTFAGRNVDLETFYVDIKKAVDKRFISKNIEAQERQFYSTLYKSTFSSEVKKANEAEVIVLDIEIYNGKKCDLMLYNNQLKKLMLLEAKVVGNADLVSDNAPKVIGQLNEYSRWLKEEETLVAQYSNYIKFVNKAFDISLNDEIQSICVPVKLVVFENNNELDYESKQKIREGLGSENVLFLEAANIEINKIWNVLDR